MAESIEALTDRMRVEEVVNRLFIGTDRRDWAAVRACFAPAVLFDMTSVAGGSPATLGPDEITSGWETGLRALDHIHHQSGNFLTAVTGDEATVFCYGIALHHKRTQSGRDSRTFVGSYDVQLRRAPTGAWVIHAFRFNLKFVEGHLELEKG
jgi:hypothetical protein